MFILVRLSFTTKDVFYRCLIIYTAFNTIGVITSVKHADHNTVSVDFHDKSSDFSRPFHFTDHLKYTLGYLGERGALFASKATYENPSTVFYRPFQTWSGKGDWTIQLPQSENAICTYRVQDFDWTHCT